VITALLGIALAITQLAPGTLLPELKGDYLTKEKAKLPADAEGQIALLALGFTYDSRHAVEDWSKKFREAFKGDGDVTFYQVPIMGGLAKLGRSFIDGGMRKGTPAEFHRNVITVYSGAKQWKQHVGYQGGDDAYLLLLDPAGKVVWTHRGQFDAGGLEKLTAVIGGLKAGLR
jgi:hypothetical protein